MILEANRSILTFGMFSIGRCAVRLVTSEVRRRFGEENYEIFRRAGKKGEYIPEETRQIVDRQEYDKAGEAHGIENNLAIRERFFIRAMQMSLSTIDMARGIQFADQDKQASLTADVAWSDRRPSTALQILTMPKKLVGERCKYEQAVQLGIADKCAEVISMDERHKARTALPTVHKFFERGLFVDKRKGDPKKIRIFSYHEPGTNKLVGVSNQYPDPKFQDGLWVKELHYPVRSIKITDSAGNREGGAQVLYEQREKDIQSLVIKAMQRSLKPNKHQLSSEGRIETLHYRGDRLGVRLVPMEGGRPLRDRIIDSLDGLLWTLDGVYHINEDDEVDGCNGDPNRFVARRRNISMRGSEGAFELSLELIVQALEDYISQAYEVGKFNPELGMHDGPAHDLYKLKMVSDIAGYLWPYSIYKIDLAEAKKTASFEYAHRLWRKQRIHPSPYLDLVA